MESLPLKDPDAKPVEERQLGMDGHVKMIKFGEDFEKWPDSRKIEYLKKLASAMNQAADGMQTERNALLEDMGLARRQLENAEKALQIQKTIVSNHLTTSNADQQKYLKQIAGLQNMLAIKETVIKELNEKLGK